MKSLTVLLATGLGLLAWAVLTWQTPPLEITNDSGLGITQFQVCLDGRAVARGSLGAGSTDRFDLDERREGRLTLDLTFASGHHSRLPAGWFSPGQAGLTRLEVISADSVRVTRR